MVGVAGEVDRPGKCAPRLLSVLCTLREAPPSEIGAEKGSLSGHFHFFSSQTGTRSNSILSPGRIALEAIDQSRIAHT